MGCGGDAGSLLVWVRAGLPSKRRLARWPETLVDSAQDLRRTVVRKDVGGVESERVSLRSCRWPAPRLVPPERSAADANHPSERSHKANLTKLGCPTRRSLFSQSVS